MQNQSTSAEEYTTIVAWVIELAENKEMTGGRPGAASALAKLFHRALGGLRVDPAPDSLEIASLTLVVNIFDKMKEQGLILEDLETLRQEIHHYHEFAIQLREGVKGNESVRPPKTFARFLAFLHCLKEVGNQEREARVSTFL